MDSDKFEGLERYRSIGPSPEEVVDHWAGFPLFSKPDFVVSGLKTGLELPSGWERAIWKEVEEETREAL